VIVALVKKPVRTVEQTVLVKVSYAVKQSPVGGHTSNTDAVVVTGVADIGVRVFVIVMGVAAIVVGVIVIVVGITVSGSTMVVGSTVAIET
jgi:hypothetical protein